MHAASCGRSPNALPCHADTTTTPPHHVLACNCCRIGIMARGRLRCLGTSLRLKARFGSGYRVSIRVQGSSGSGDSATAHADSGSAAGAMAGGIPSAGARLGLEDCEIQPAPLAVQPGLHPAAPPQRSGSNHSGRSVSGEPAEQAQQRDPVAARQAAGVKALFLRQLGIKPGECCWVHSVRFCSRIHGSVMQAVCKRSCGLYPSHSHKRQRPFNAEASCG